MSNIVSIDRPSGKAGLFSKLVATQPSRAQLVLRVGLAAMLWPHGAQKLLGWFGGYGFKGTMGAMSQNLPAPLVFLVILGEFFFPLFLLAGLGTRAAAVGVGLIMAGAALLVHFPNGFFMNWFGNQAGEGFEFHLLAISIVIALVFRGAGSLSLDSLLSQRKDLD